MIGAIAGYENRHHPILFDDHRVGRVDAVRVYSPTSAFEFSFDPPKTARASASSFPPEGMVDASYLSVINERLEDKALIRSIAQRDEDHDVRPRPAPLSLGPL